MSKELPSLEEMLKNGVHFGHIKEKWHPKMKPYVFAIKNGVWVIDLEKTQSNLKRAIDFMEQLLKEGKTILFVGTKRQIRESVKKIAEELKMPYVDFRWLGGTLTNFDTVRKALKKMRDSEMQLENPEFMGKMTKKEQKNFQVNLEKMQRSMGGMRDLNKLPEAMFIIDTVEEKVAVDEANRLKIPLIAIVDTNSDPSKINYPIPANDDSRLGVELILNTISENLAQVKNVVKAENVKTEIAKTEIKKLKVAKIEK